MPATPSEGERPASRLPLLSVQGAPPPSRNGTARVPTTSSPRTAKEAEEYGALTAQLIKRMRTKFGEAAADVKAQEIITQEVVEFMRKKKGGRIKEEDIGLLQERIRARLTGDTPVKNTLVAQIRARVEGDEWARIFEYHIQEGLAQQKAESEAQRVRQLELKSVLDRQMKEQAGRVAQEAADEQAYFREEQAQLRSWEAQEEERRRLRLEILEKLRLEREGQLMEQRARRELAFERRRADEDVLAARIAYETRAEFDREEAARVAAKVALKEFLLSNEVNKKIKEEAKKKAWEEDLAYQKKWEEQLDKQERERLDRLTRLKRIQDQQAEVAKTRPEAKRWIDQAVIDRYYKEREDARAAEDDARTARLKETGRRMVSALGQQMREREAAREAQIAEEEVRKREMLAKVAEDERREAERRARLAAQKLTWRQQLEEQMKENAVRRRVAPMTEVERRINTQLLKRVHEFQATGSVDLSHSTALAGASPRRAATAGTATVGAG